jgi:hypothetical protein
MTRARAQALHQEVNSLLSMYAFDTPLDGLLLHANTLCSIRYIDQEASHEDQANGERAGNDEDGATAARPELPPSRTGTSAQMPSRFPPDAVQRPEDRIRPELPPRGTGTSAHRNFRPSSAQVPKVGENHTGCYCGTMAQFRNKAGTWPELPPRPELPPLQTGTSAPDRNFRPR